MTESRFVHAGHVNGSPVVPTGIPGMPLAPACCVDQSIVVLDGDRLRKARRKAGLSREQLAHESGVSATTIGKLESQDRPRCRFRTHALIAAALGTKPQAITAGLWDEPEPASGIRTALISADAPGDARSARGRFDSRTFPARADQVARARAFVRGLVADCPVADDVVLICSELASNAVLHSASAMPGGHFTVRADVRTDGCAWIEVEDQGGRWVARRGPDEHGRGLTIVAALSAHWHVRGDDSGRVIRAWLTRPDNHEGPGGQEPDSRYADGRGHTAGKAVEGGAIRAAAARRPG